MFRSLNVLLALSFLAYSSSYAKIPMKTNWEFEFISVGFNSSDKSILDVNVKLTQIKRGQYGLSGHVKLNGDVVPNDDTMVEALIYRSATGTSEYRLTPFTMKKQHFFDFLNSLYKDIVMESLHKCSDLPYFKDKFQPPLQKKTYTLKSCIVTNEGLPPYMNDGFYKIHLIGTGQVRYFLEVVVKVLNET